MADMGTVGLDAANGGAAGAAGGPVGTAVGAGIGILGGLLTKPKKASTPNLQPVLNAIQAGKTEQGAISSALPGKLAPLSTAYKGNIEDAIKSARGGMDTANAGYVAGVGDTSNGMFQKQAAMLKQQQLDASTAAARGMRSNLAATGNLNSGAGVAAARGLATETANTIGRGETALGVQGLAAKQQALSDTYQQNAGLVEKTLGIDANMFQTLLNSGREDLIDEATQLIQESQSATGQMAGVYGAAANNAAVAGNANAAAGNDLTTAIVQALAKGGGALASRTWDQPSRGTAAGSSSTGNDASAGLRA